MSYAHSLIFTKEDSKHEYLYDNAGQECEFLNTAENGAPIH